MLPTETLCYDSKLNTGNSFLTYPRCVPTDSEKGYRGGPGLGSRHPPAPQGDNHYPDAQQLFLGNIPLSAQEEELRALFSQFGAVLDLRILNKTGKGPHGHGQGNRVTPNYGFVIYEDASTVEHVLNQRVSHCDIVYTFNV